MLHYQHRSIDQEQAGRPITTETLCLFNVLAPGPNGERIIQTFQGLLDDVIACCHRSGRNTKVHDTRLKFPMPALHLMHGFRFSQRDLLTTALLQNRSGLIGAPTRYGKCLGLGTPVMMFTGYTKPVEQIQEGDFVMGHDGTPRRVVGVVKGRDQMYRITPNSGGDSWVCTQDHVLCLWRTPQGSRKKSPKKDRKEYLFTAAQVARSSKTFKHLHKLVRRSINYTEGPLVVDPYIYGLWLGDGTSDGPAITTADAKVAWDFIRYAKRNGMGWRSTKQPNNKSRVYTISKGLGYRWKGLKKDDGSRRCLFDAFTRLSNKPEGKRILSEYLFNSKENRLQLLAGLIDSDGYSNGGMTFAITTKWEGLRDDILRLARSLGFLASNSEVWKSCPTANGVFRGKYQNIGISGRIGDIPVRLERKKIGKLKHRRNPLISGFKIEAIGEDAYFGFELEGPDKLFLLGDFTVTHNTTLIINTLRAFPNLRTVVTAPGIDLLKQTQADIV